MSATSDPSTATTGTSTGAVAPPDAPATPLPAPPTLYTVNRTQDGAQVRAELTLEQAKEECGNLNGQSRVQTGLTAPIRDNRGEVSRGPVPIFGSMFHGEICRYEVRSASGLVV